jgi:putative ABC transport system permease protein
VWEYRQRLHGIEDVVEYHSMSFVLLDRGTADRVNAGVLPPIPQYPRMNDVFMPTSACPFRAAAEPNARTNIRTTRDPHELARPLVEIVRSVDDTIPVSNIASTGELREAGLQAPRVSTMLLSTFAALALTIMLAGVAAVVATSVSQRTREFGVRMALGASRRSVLTMVMRQGLGLVLAGLAVGVGGALGFGRLLGRYLYDTPPSDRRMYLGVGALVLVAGLLACVGPACRAISIDPIEAVRSE